MKSPLYVAVAVVLIASGCNNEPKKVSADRSEDSEVLPSWNDSPSKRAIIDFVEAATNEGDPNFIPVEDRLCTFDNDGTLWAEKPVYFQLYYALDRIEFIADNMPEWKDEEPYRSALAKDVNSIAAQGYPALFKLIGATHGGMTTGEYEGHVKAWIDTAVHPALHKRYTELTYQPMKELISYLQDHDFNVYIVSGGGVDFMRAWASEVYGIPSDHIIGSSMEIEFVADGAFIQKSSEIAILNDKEIKPLSIYQHTGMTPVVAGGNSDGDLAMLQYTATNSLPFLNIYVHHTDSIREWAYDRSSHVGKLDEGLDEAMERGWTIVDMAKDWKTIYGNDQ